MPEALSDEWITNHFDVTSPELASCLHETLARARQICPVAHTDAGGGYWVATRYEDVLAVAQNWQTYSNAYGIGPPREGGGGAPGLRMLPVGVDPPVHREFKRLINSYFSPAAIQPWEAPTRRLVHHLIDQFIEQGECEFMQAFARPLPGLSFFELALHAPEGELQQVNEWATQASVPDPEVQRQGLQNLSSWIAGLLQQRRETGRQDDVVDAVLAAEIEGRPITEAEAIGTIQLLVLGGLETTAGVLGMTMLRFCEHPDIPALLRSSPELIPQAVEELLRLDGSFICIGRTTRSDGEIGGCHIPAGERVMIYWASANRDDTEVEQPDEFDLDRSSNRHLAFGAGPHRCTGSNLARMNLRIAIEALVDRLHDVRTALGAEIEWHSTTNRTPLAVPIKFTPGSRIGRVHR